MKVDNNAINGFKEYLIFEERCQGTIAKYLHDVTAFSLWLADRNITKENLSEWKEYLQSNGYEASTINSMLAAVHTFCRFYGLDIKVKFMKIQRKIFREEKRELCEEEYKKLVKVARDRNNEKIALLMETIASTGIRVSEVSYITLEALIEKKATIYLKGKIREILLPAKLCKKLLSYAKKVNISAGPIFITKNNKKMSRKQIWLMMKKLAKQASIEESKVFPHNLRHLFACTFYRVNNDVVKLADLLGHSSIETTRFYLLSSCAEHIKQLDNLNLIL